jgi:hypothetical protein
MLTDLSVLLGGDREISLPTSLRAVIPVSGTIALFESFLLRHVLALFGVSIPASTGTVIDARFDINPHPDVGITDALAANATNLHSSGLRLDSRTAEHNEEDERQE